MTANDEKAARRAAALRANLQRRKGRARDAAEAAADRPLGADNASFPPQKG